MKQKLSYRNEDDKCYGATGMAVAIVIFDGEDMLAGMDIDSEPESIMQFTEDFYFNGNPGFSAKNAWNQILKNFNLTMALSLGNVICRNIMYNSKTVDEEIKRYLHDLMVEEGRSNCALDDDETTRLFEKNYSYLTRVFNHSGVQSIARSFASAIKAKRRMTRMDILEQLRELSML